MRAAQKPEFHFREGCCITERHLILAGTGRVEVDGVAPSIVEPGDVVLIPPGAAQRITNTGHADLVFLAACTPRFRDECYRDLGTDPEE